MGLQRVEPAVMTRLRFNHGVSEERWRYVRDHDGSEKPCDYTTDPSEFNSLAGEPQSASLITGHGRWQPNDIELCEPSQSPIAQRSVAVRM